MKAIVCKSPGLLTWIDKDIPESKEGEVLVKIKRIGICGTDLHAYDGTQPFFSYPRILGHELAAEVAEATDEFNIGDEVVVVPYWVKEEDQAVRRNKSNCSRHMQVLGVHLDGGMQEWISVPRELLLEADGISLEQMAMVECMGIGAHAVRRAHIEKGDKVLVIGAGPIGVGVIQFAQIAGAEVIVMDLDEHRLAYCKNSLGVAYTLNPGKIPSVEDQLLAWTDGEFPYIAFDVTGSQRSMQNAFNYVAHGGSLIYVGLIKGDIQFYDPDFHKKELTLKSSRNATMDDLAYVIECMRNGSIESEAFITHKVPFEEAIDTFPSLLNKENHVMKAMILL